MPAVLSGLQKSLPELALDLVRANEKSDMEAVNEALHAVGRRTPEADPAELTAAAAAIAPALAEADFLDAAPIGYLAGHLVEMGADPAVVLEPLANQVAAGLMGAVVFPERWSALTGTEVPPGDAKERLPEVMDRISDSDDAVAAMCWFTIDEWMPAMLVTLQQREARRMLPYREELLAAATAAGGVVDGAHWLYGLLMVLDDEPAIVLHRETGRGYRVTFGGIGDNFQLHTLLAATLIGDPDAGLLPGIPPRPQWVAAATDGDLQPAVPVEGQFNLVDGYGKWIWNEGRPADIPHMDGTRVIVLDPPPYPRRWNIGRVYPLMRPTLTVDGPLPADEAARWLARVAPEASPD